MKFTALIFTLLVLSQAYATFDQQDSQFTVSQDYDEIEKFFMNHVVPLYQHIKASNNLNLTIKAVLGSFFVAFCIRVCLNIISRKDQDSDLIKEIRDLKKQFKALKEEKSSNNNNKESLDEIKNELKSLRETLKENETSTSDLLKQKEKLDGFVMDFQTEVVDSHKAIWNELRALKRIVSNKRPAGVKIPPKEKPTIATGYCQSADLEGAAKAEPQTSLPAIVNTDRKKSATVAPTQKQSIFAKNSRKFSEPESSGRQIDSAETKAEPDSGFPREKENESPSAPEAQTPLTQLIKQATGTLSASMFGESPLKGDVFLTPKPLGNKRMTILSSRKIIANSPRPLVPQSLF